MSISNFTVEKEEEGQRLDKYLAAKTGLSRSFVQTLIQNSSRKIKSGEEISIEIPDAKPLDLTPWDFPLDIIFENTDLLVINKPIGLAVHPAAGNWEHTLVHALLAHCKGGLSGINGVERPGIVHRLDKDTSGLMVVAKTDEAHKRLAAQIESREIKRSYLCVVQGIPNPTSGNIKTGFGRHPKDRKKMTTYDLTEPIMAGGGARHGFRRDENWEIEIGHKTEFGLERGEGRKAKIAITDYNIKEVLGRGLASIVECRLQTGRTHQIRVHMKHIKCPIIGDQTYGPQKKPKNLPELGRQALHAYKLEIPDVGIFESEPPEDMQKLISALKNC
jgi:23S rRNA pseudouridine1911/1915/1917 synthase